MALTHPLLLLGLVAAGVPVILHLMLRAKPKQLLFPALRLIQNRKKQNVQRMRLRHILLMLLRILVIALLVFAITRPKVPAGDYAPNGFDWLRLGLVLGGTALVYFAVTAWWKRRKWPRHVVQHRQSLLRYGLGGLALLAFLGGVAWPYGRRVAASIADPQIKAGQDVPVAAVLLFDTSLSMQYRQENRTRLEIAREIAERHLSGFPAGSRAAVADTTGDAPIRLQSVTASRARLSQIELRPFSRPLNDRLEAALQALWDDRQKLGTAEGGTAGNSQEQFAREVYVFTDLAISAWRLAESPRLAQLFQQLPGVHVYVIDVGVPAPQNLALTTLSLSDETTSLGAELAVRATLEGMGVPAGEHTVQLFFENDNGKLVDKGKSTVKVEPGQPVQLAFSLPGLTGTARQGEIRLAASDPLEFDNALRFSVLVQPPPKVLVVSDRARSAAYVADALAPPDLVKLGKARYECKSVSPAQLSGEKLKDYVAVWLVNVGNPRPLWKALGEYVEQGGGLGVILGDQITREAQSHYFTAEALDLLPGQLVATKLGNSDVFLDLHDLEHPIHSRFKDWGTADLTSIPMERYWKVEPQKDARTIAKYTGSNLPALLVRGHGKGQVVMLTTAIDRPSSLGRGAWNDLITLPRYVIWLDQMTRFLAQAKAVAWNHLAGSPVTVPLPETPPLDRYLLRKPNREQLPGEVPPKATALTLQDLDQLGNYRVISTEPRLERGFSVNADPAESRLKRLTDSELGGILPPGRFSVARSVETLDRKVRDGRIGREIYPAIVLLLAAVFIGEQFVANWFYGTRAIV